MTTKATRRRSFTDGFKREAVSLLASSGRPLKVAGVVGSGLAAAPSAEQAEIRRLRRELERAQMERDISTKAVGIFSGPPR